MRNLSIESDENIHTFALNSKGEISFRIEGEHTTEKANQITEIVKGLIQENSQ